MQNAFMHPNEIMNELDKEFKTKSVLVYEIKNKVNNRKYYGITRDVEARIKTHLSSLRNNKHTSIEMQNDCNELGIEQFSISVVDIALSREWARNIEAELIKGDDSSYNVMGNKYSKRRKEIMKHTNEKREEAKLQGKHLGRPSQPKKEISRALQLYADRESNGNSVNDIVKLTGVPRSTIYAEIKKQGVGANESK